MKNIISTALFITISASCFANDNLDQERLLEKYIINVERYVQEIEKDGKELSELTPELDKRFHNIKKAYFNLLDEYNDLKQEQKNFDKTISELQKERDEFKEAYQNKEKELKEAEERFNAPRYVLSEKDAKILKNDIDSLFEQEFAPASKRVIKEKGKLMELFKAIGKPPQKQQDLITKIKQILIATAEHTEKIFNDKKITSGINSTNSNKNKNNKQNNIKQTKK